MVRKFKFQLISWIELFKTPEAGVTSPNTVPNKITRNTLRVIRNGFKTRNFSRLRPDTARKEMASLKVC